MTESIALLIAAIAGGSFFALALWKFKDKCTP